MLVSFFFLLPLSVVFVLTHAILNSVIWAGFSRELLLTVSISSNEKLFPFQSVFVFLKLFPASDFKSTWVFRQFFAGVWLHSETLVALFMPSSLPVPARTIQKAFLIFSSCLVYFRANLSTINCINFSECARNELKVLSLFVLVQRWFLLWFLKFYPRLSFTWCRSENEKLLSTSY